MQKEMNKNYLGIDVGGSKILVGVLDGEGKVLAEKRIYSSSPLRGADIIESVKTAAKELPLSGVTAGGVTVPGIADNESGLWVSAPFFGIENWRVADELSTVFKIPFAAENDVKACALAERKFGLCKNTDNFLWITLSNGVGGAFFLDGKLFRGARNAAGEIGHLVVEENGILCDCGSRGCLETAASGRAISRRYFDSCGLNKTAKEIAELAKDGDKDAVAAYDRAGKCLGTAIAAAVNLADLETVVVGGGVGQSLDLLLPSLKKEYEKKVFSRVKRDVKIVYTALGYDAALIGTAAIAEEL